jgi:two-component system, OmpR family, response regulator
MKDPKAKATTAKKILIIEDEGDMCLILDLILHGKDTTVDHVRTLAAAEAYLLAEQPALIVLDNRLPDGFGLDFIGFLKSTYPAARILMISGVDAAAADLAIESGADAFLSKPFSKAQLSDAVRQLLTQDEPMLQA